MDCSIRVAKTKALIKLICVFVFAYAKSRFSHNEAHMYGSLNKPAKYVERPFRLSKQVAMVAHLRASRSSKYFQ